jgi:hypothetical protein
MIECSECRVCARRRGYEAIHSLWGGVVDRTVEQDGLQIGLYSRLLVLENGWGRQKPDAGNWWIVASQHG